MSGWIKKKVFNFLFAGYILLACHCYVSIAIFPPIVIFIFVRVYFGYFTYFPVCINTQNKIKKNIWEIETKQNNRRKQILFWFVFYFEFVEK